MYIITTVDRIPNFKWIRTIGMFNLLREAKKACEGVSGESMWENLYDYAVIEKVLSGELFPMAQFVALYRFEEGRYVPASNQEVACIENIPFSEVG